MLAHGRQEPRRRFVRGRRQGSPGPDAVAAAALRRDPGARTPAGRRLPTIQADELLEGGGGRPDEARRADGLLRDAAECGGRGEVQAARRGLPMGGGPDRGRRVSE